MLVQKYQLSPNLRIVTDKASGSAMAYHTLYGNPRVVNEEGMRFLNLFKDPIEPSKLIACCDGDTEQTIKDFADILFLVEPGFNEKDFLHEQKSRHLADVSNGKTIDRMGLAISDSCNFGCKHCIHLQPLNNAGPALPAYRRPVAQLNMTWETAKRCIDKYVSLMQQQGRTLCRIHFGNAEPLINWPLIEKVLDYCSRMKGLSFEYAINTNLSLMTRKIAEKFKSFHVRIATSLDGMPQANDAIRVTKGGHGTFKQIMDRFDMLSDIGYPLDGFSTTVTKVNFDLIDTDIIDWASERKMTSIAFDYDLVGLVDVPISERVGKLMLFKKRANELGIDFIGTWDSAFRNLTSESLLVGSHSFCAAVSGKSLEFNVDGSIKVCSHVTEQVGHVDQFDQMFASSGGLLNLVANRFPGTDTGCSGCAIEGPCAGQCHVTREVVTRAGKEDHRRLFEDMCGFYRSITDALILNYLSSATSTLTSIELSCNL